MRILFGFILLFLPIFTSAEGKHFYFSRIGIEDGLSQNTVWCILQDSNGFIWLGTKDGLNKYDGNTFKIYRSNSEESSLKCNFIRSLYEHDDGKIWVGTLLGIYIYNPATGNFSFFNRSTDDGVAITSEINDIKTDKHGNIWICSNWQGVFKYNSQTDELILYKHTPDDLNSLSSPNPWSICVDDEGTVWIGCHNGDLNRFNRKMNNFERRKIGAGVDVYKIKTDKSGILLIGTSKGTYILNPYTDKLQKLLENTEFSDSFVRDIELIGSSEIWIGTETGIIIYNIKETSYTHLVQDYNNPYSLSCNSIYSIFKDKDNGIWIGTYFGGISYVSNNLMRFEKYFPGNPEMLSGKAVREFTEDNFGRIWIGTEDAGLNSLDLKTGKIRHFNTENSGITSNNIHGLYADNINDKLYIGTFGGGLCVMDLHSMKIERHYGNEGRIRISDNNVFSICGDNSGKIWIGTIYGLNILDPETHIISQIEGIDNNAYIYDIAQSPRGIMYMAIYNQGVVKYDPYTRQCTKLPLKSTTGEIRYPISLTFDNESNLWVGTEGDGLIRVADKKDSLEVSTFFDGQVIYCARQDKTGNVWITTNNGLLKLDPESGTYRRFTKGDGLPSEQFNYKSEFISSDGKFYVGTINGFARFSPETLVPRQNDSRLIFTEFRITSNGHEREIHLTQSSGKIKLKHKEANFIIGFSLLSYDSSRQNQYKYKLDGFDNKWHYIKSNMPVSYTNVSAGRYKFEVYGANSDGIWTNHHESIEIIVRPQLYKSTFAYILYIAAFILSIVFIYKILKQKQERRQIERQNIREHMEYRAKIEFFTNLAHEIRTPLSLIKGPFEQIANPSISKHDYDENISIMRVNIDRLLSLINQLLDFRKVDTGNMPIEKTTVNIKTLIKTAATQFAQTLKQKNISIEYNFDEKELYANVDREAFVKIVSNILDNAIKFAEKKVQIAINSNSDTFCLEIRNDGTVIPEEFRNRIFDPFFQVDSNRLGTGLGLPLVKKLVEQHKGTITVGTDNGFTCFSISIPMTSDTDASKSLIPEENSQDRDSGRLQILIVEDDESMRMFLKNLLSLTYDVVLKDNASKALRYMEFKLPDFIICDIMMPGIGGIEFCRTIKTKLDYSHIPVLMLSAKTDINTKISCLDAGAEVFMEKPFSSNYLLAQIRSIFQNRQKLKNSYCANSSVGITSLASTDTDKDFLDKLNSIVLNNISENDFNIDQFAEAMNMSRSSLHRKIKGMFQMTPNDLVKMIKLKKAAEMLTTEKYRINEICYMTGFTSPSYFSKCFLKQYGCLPKDYQLKHKNNE